MRRAVPSRSGRRVLAVFTTLMIAAMSVIGMPIAATAAPNDAIVVDHVVIGEGSGPDGQLILGDVVTVTGDWDASEADPQAGDSFVIGLPPELNFEASLPINLTGVNPAGELVTWAACISDPDTGELLCVLTDQVTDYPEEVRGTFEFEVAVELTTVEVELIFNLNGIETPVVIPPGGIGDGVELPVEWTKSGWMNSNNWSMTWQIDLPGARMTEDSLTIVDTLGEGHVLCEPSGLTVQTVRGDAVGTFTGTKEIVPGDDGTFSIVLGAPEGGFDPNVVYRVTYQTCTPNKTIDSYPTEYTNEARIPAWNSGSDVIGVGNKPWQGSITKSGSVLGSTSRNGTIAWTVTVPGDALVNKNSFTLSEKLGEGHEVRDSTISGLRIVERYGPSNQRDREITDRLDKTVVSQETDSFELLFSVPDGSDFSFKASDYRYIITYETYVTETDLPQGGTAYTNSATVEGTTTTGTAKVPGRSQGKSGTINGSFVTIDGIEYAPQTTLDWTVRIPGEKLAETSGPLTLTDTLEGTHTVCAPGDPTGGEKSRLNLAVTARDQIINGGLQTVNLTDSTEVEFAKSGDGKEQIVLTIPEPTLAMPGGGEATGFSQEYQYLVTYTTCTTSGGMDAPDTRYGNEVVGSSVTFSQAVVQTNRGSGTGTGVARGSITINKTLDESAPGAGFVPDGAMFTVHVKEIDPTGTTQVEYDLKVPLNGDPVRGLNARGTGWTAELSEPTFPAIPGVLFGEPSFTVDGEKIGPTATVSLDPGTNVAVGLTNTTRLGEITLVKAVDVRDESIILPERTYTVTAHIDTSALENVPAQDDRTVHLTPDQPVTIDNLPIGATVTFSESGLVDDNTLTWGQPVFSPSTVIVGDPAAPVTVEVLNSVTRTVGTFSIAKTVTGEQADNPAVPETVTILASWNEEGTPGETTLEVPTDGTPVPLGVDLLIGTRVTLTEVPLENGSSIAWGTPTWSANGVTVDSSAVTVTVNRDDASTVTVENHANTSTATLGLVKAVAGEAAGEVSPETQFPVTASWVDREGNEQSRDLLINSVAPTPLGVDLPAGTVVTITEGDRPGFDTVEWGEITISGDRVENAGEGTATVTVSDLQGDVTLVTVTNEATWAPSTIQLSKDLADTAGAGFVPDGTMFTVHVQEFTPEGVLSSEYDLDVPLNGDPVSTSNDFGPGWSAVLTEPAFPEISGVHFGHPVFEASDGVAVSEDGQVATITYVPGRDFSVRLTNVAELGSISLVKAVEGGAADRVDPERTYTVTAHIDTSALGENVPAQADREIQLTAGEPVIIDDLPIGATVTFTETPLVDDDILTWGQPVFSPESVVVGVENVDEPAAVTLTNSVERTVGTFSISKTVTGEQADNPAVPETVTILALWNEEGTAGETTLEVPTDGTPVPLGVDLLIGTRVTLTEVPLENGSSIAWAQPAWSGDHVVVDGENAVVTVSRDAEAGVLVENHAATSVAGISIVKAVAGEAAGEISPETEFPVTASWVDREGNEQSRELFINSVAPTPLGVDLPAGTVVTITEGDRPGFDTVVWDAIVIGGQDVEDQGDGTATVTVSDLQGDVTLVTVTNEATWAPGSFSLAKNITGVLLDNADVPASVTVTASWIESSDGQLVTVTREIEIPTDGTPVAFGEDLPHGTAVTLVETPTAGAPAFTWDTPAWSGSESLVVHEDGSATLTIGAAQNPTVTVTNNATQALGDVTLVKKLSGTGAPAVPADTTYPVRVEWTDLLGVEQSRDVELVAGQPVVIDGLPLGTELRVTEGEFAAPDGATWKQATWSSDSDSVSITGDGISATIVVTAGDASVTLDNAYDIVEKPSGPSTLPWTGASVGMLAGLALLLLGGGLFAMRRARS
ncbi:DUF5979 domain-containing protein [Flaviflexus equikiangi]|uniref:DUF5979 domain-containing protein n=1 Tax=Flaviflexus equikiangi TaxID=2758573 RepID=UPI0015F66EC6|nr:DUF5979 domain-containing protein [Flaviflexus equikiangi]